MAPVTPPFAGFFAILWVKNMEKN